MNNVYDVIVVGGGLAGLALSIQLAEAGRTVLLIERKAFPFHKVCGEYIAMESWGFLERIGVPLQEMQLPRIRQLEVTTVNGSILKHRLNPGGFGISRYLLDATLAGIARSKGVSILENTRADEIVMRDGIFLVRAGQDQFVGKLVAGAFGKRSNIDLQMKRSFAISSKTASRNWIGVKYHLLCDLPADTIQLHNFHGGYCGISKVEGDLYCLCYLTKAENLRRQGGSIRSMEDHILSGNPGLRRIFMNRSNIQWDEPETIAQVCFDRKEAVEQHVIMVGDAAGLIAPLCGNGMSMALHASVFCFGIMEKFLSSLISRQEMETEYERSWQKHFKLRTAAGNLLQPLLVNASLTSPVIGLLKHFPSVVNRLVRVTHGEAF